MLRPSCLTAAHSRWRGDLASISLAQSWAATNCGVKRSAAATKRMRFMGAPSVGGKDASGGMERMQEGDDSYWLMGAGGGKLEQLSDFEVVRIVEQGVCLGNARPVGGVSVDGERDVGERVAPLNRCSRTEWVMAGGLRRQDERAAWN